jgi:hypothetical protein
MFALIATLVMFLLVLILLFPGSAQDLMLARTPVEIRPDPDRLGLKLVPTVAIFVFGFAMFQGWDRFLHASTGSFRDPHQVRMTEAIAVIILLAGVSGCTSSRRILNKLAPGLRDSSTKSQTLAIAIQLFGVICLLVAVQLFRRSAQ